MVLVSYNDCEVEVTIYKALSMMCDMIPSYTTAKVILLNCIY